MRRQPAGLAAAVRGGASRIELCSALALSGVTPSPGFMRLAARSGVPAYPMIRPHAGPYHYDRDDLFVMRRDMQTAKEAGLTGVVIGANLADGRLDLETLKPLCDIIRDRLPTFLAFPKIRQLIYQTTTTTTVATTTTTNSISLQLVWQLHTRSL